MNYYLRRVGQSLFTVWAVLTLSFALVRWMPGGPIDFVRQQLMMDMDGPASQEEMERINELVEIYTNVDPDEPLWVQYGEYLKRTLQFDLGKSQWYGDPVAQVLGDGIPWTLFLSSVSLLVIFLSGIAIGAVMAYKEGGRFDVTMTSIQVWLHGVPYYVIAILLVFVLGYQLNWFPISGRTTSGTTPGLNWPFIAGVLYHATLPLASTIIAGFGGPALQMRANSISVLGNDYVRVARLRGLTDTRIALRYVARNAILPMYTGLMISIGFMFGGSIILEQIFGYVGVGFYMFKGIQARDYPLMMGGFLIITVAVVIGILIADLTYGKIDPRIQDNSEEAF